jgi:methionine aminopeptidase
VIEKYATTQGCSVIKTYCGHGINTNFHPPPNIPHYAKNKQVGACKEGICFTIEPMIALGTYRDKTWPDDWTSVTADGKKTAQFGMWLSGKKGKCPMLICYRAYSSCYQRWRRSIDCKISKLTRRTS